MVKTGGDTSTGGPFVPKYIIKCVNVRRDVAGDLANIGIGDIEKMGIDFFNKVIKFPEYTILIVIVLAILYLVFKLILSRINKNASNSK